MAGEDPSVNYVHKWIHQTHRQCSIKYYRKQEPKHKFIDSKEDKLCTRCVYKHEQNLYQALGQTCNKCHEMDYLHKFAEPK